jgi:AcrR family transcriptional regulator
VRRLPELGQHRDHARERGAGLTPEPNASSAIEAYRFESPAEQSARRRAQFVAAIAHLVVTQGVASVTHAAVARLAGCARSLVYRYFPRQEDLLYTLLSTFAEMLNQRMSFDEEVAGVVAMKDVRRGHIPPATRVLFEKLWTADDWQPVELEFRLACVILMRDSSLRAVLGDHDSDLQRSVEARLGAPLRSLGLDAIETAIVVDSMLSVMHHVTRTAREGALTREEALELFASVNGRVLQTFTDKSRGDRRAAGSRHGVRPRS